MHEAAGVLGIDPGPLTLRELFWRFHGRMRAEWVQVSQLSVLIASIAPRKKDARHPRQQDFTPYRLTVDERVSFKTMLKLMSSAGKAIEVELERTLDHGRK